MKDKWFLWCGWALVLINGLDFFVTAPGWSKDILGVAFGLWLVVISNPKGVSNP